MVFTSRMFRLTIDNNFSDLCDVFDE
jgi:hypothetical protein